MAAGGGEIDIGADSSIVKGVQTACTHGSEIGRRERATTTAGACRCEQAAGRQRENAVGRSMRLERDGLEISTRVYES